jgi:hypothetical protein
MRDRGSNCKQLKKTASAKTANRIKPAQSKPEIPATLTRGNNNPTINKNLQQIFPVLGIGLLPKQSKYALPLERQEGRNAQGILRRADYSYQQQSSD